MSFVGYTQRVIIYLLFSILAFSHQCFTTDDTDEKTQEDREHLDNDFFRSTTKKRHVWEYWTHVPTYETPPKYDGGGYSGGGDPTIFFVILGVVMLIFIGLLFLCKMVRDEATNSDSRSIPGTVTPPSIPRAGGIDGTISFIGTASNNPSHGPPGISRQTSEKPPDYATVTSGDLSYEKSMFPSVVRQKCCETPPPKYDENNPMFE